MINVIHYKLNTKRFLHRRDALTSDVNKNNYNQHNYTFDRHLQDFPLCTKSIF